MKYVTFLVNGVQHSVGSEVSSTTTLLDYIRNTIGLRGTKYMCREAGCGACIVNVHKGQGSQGVNSCMVQVTSCQDWVITTIEGVGNRKDGYHPLQLCLAENNGTQCGYCSPGWVMAMYSLLKNKPLTQLEIEDSLGSNVCRCTGYRPILQAFKKFATDAPSPHKVLDIEDLNICKKTGENCLKERCDDSSWCLISKQVPKNKIHFELHDHREFYKVEKITDIFDILQEKGTNSYMLVAGNTAKGAVPIEEYPYILIDITGVSELKGYYIDQNLVIGANTILNEVSDIFETVGNKEEFRYLKTLHDHLQLVAHIPVKNLATIAGNLMLKNRFPYFQSDIFLLLTTVGAQLTILTGPEHKKVVTMLEFLQEDMRRKLIFNVIFSPMNMKYGIWTNKIMPRSQNAHAFVNCGFLYKLNRDNIVTDSTIVYGGLSPEFTRAFKTEKFLVGKPLFNNETLQAALDVLDEELVVKPIPPNPSVEYRKQLAMALFYKGLLALCPRDILNWRYASGEIKLHPNRPVSCAQQKYETDPSTYPLNEPISKIDGLIQCAGEAKYTEDVPPLPDEVFATFVLTTVPLGRIVSIDPSDALRQQGVVAFYSAKDIPGVNSFIPVEPKYQLVNEELLCDGNVRYYNQPLGIIVATDLATSERAAKLVKVIYENVRRPVIDIKEAKNDPTRSRLLFTVPSTKHGTDVKRILRSEKTVYGQYHFCMETLVCVSHPTEHGLQVYAATQWMDNLQQALSRLLKLDSSRIDITVRRLGGGYGFKLTRASAVAAACSLVAFKLNRPCRFIQALRNNMRAFGKRFPGSTNSELGVNDNGVIQYINHNFYTDNGYIINELLIAYGADAYYNCYDESPWTYTVYEVTTDTPSNSWCRAPTTLENTAFCEWIMEQISYELGLNQLDVRLANLDKIKHKDILDMIETVKKDSDFEQRRTDVDKYNSQNRWKKRGLRFALLKWTPVGPHYLDINLSVYHKDGTVTITHGGIEMGQGINTIAIQICAYFLKIPVEKIQIKPNESHKCPNSYASGASITTQNMGIAVQRSCEQLLQRLEPIRAQLGNPTWEELVQKAFEMDVDLQTHGFVNRRDMQMYYIYAVALCEVEIDILTGESEILRVDLMEDVGRSVNPSLDVGQVEGAFIMGVGYWTSEELVYDSESGELLTDRTWEYWVPQARDIPQDFRISFRKRSFSKDIILGAKATGEPATCLGVGVAIALREAIVEARSESGIPKNRWFEIDGPYTVEKIFLYSETNRKDFRFY